MIAHTTRCYCIPDFVWQLWRAKSRMESITVHSERNTQILFKKELYKCNRKPQFGYRTFSYSHTVLYVVCISKLFLCGMISFLTCPLPRLWVPQFVMALPIPSTMPYLLWPRECVMPLPLFVPALQTC